MRAGAGVAGVLRSIAANVRRVRAQRGMTQESLAELADLDLRFLQRIEAGRTNLGIAVLVALSRALGTSPSALLRKAELRIPARGRPRAKAKNREAT